MASITEILWLQWKQSEIILFVNNNKIQTYLLLFSCVTISCFLQQQAHLISVFSVEHYCLIPDHFPSACPILSVIGIKSKVWCSHVCVTESRDCDWAPAPSIFLFQRHAVGDLWRLHRRLWKTGKRVCTVIIKLIIGFFKVKFCGWQDDKIQLSVDLQCKILDDLN